LVEERVAAGPPGKKIINDAAESTDYNELLYIANGILGVPSQRLRGLAKIGYKFRWYSPA
jgi:hypothetical protein